LYWVFQLTLLHNQDYVMKKHWKYINMVLFVAFIIGMAVLAVRLPKVSTFAGVTIVLGVLFALSSIISIILVVRDRAQFQ